MFEHVFIAVYTNKCKEYCDYLFFHELELSDTGNAKIRVVDNTQGLEYTEKLKREYSKFDISHVDVSTDDPGTQFQRNVAESLAVLQDEFLAGDYRFFIILESDVIPLMGNWLSKFMEVVDEADIIGALYYKGFQPEELWTGLNRVVPTHHVLSGCSLYKREVLERFRFRWSMDNLGAFPDAWMSFDAGQDFKLANYTGIKCRHIEKAPGDRGHGEIR